MFHSCITSYTIYRVSDYDISKILSSRARFRILEVLCSFRSPLPLRHLEALTGLAIRSIQVAAAGLEEEGVILAQRRARSVRYFFNNRHPAFSVIQEVFAVTTRNQILRRSARYHRAAQASLRFSTEAQMLLRRSNVKRDRNSPA